MRTALVDSEWPHASLGARALAWCASCEDEGQALWRFESFLKSENRAEARFLRGAEVCSDEELERTEWAVEELEAMESRWAEVAGASSMTVSRGPGEERSVLGALARVVVEGER
jgi:hypothetical protein